MLKRKDEDVWTPYGLEALRQQTLRKRQVRTLLIAGLVVFAIMGLTETTTTVERQIYVDGERRSGLEIEVPERDEEEQRNAVTISVSPGRISELPTMDPEPQAPPPPVDQGPSRDVGEPIDWLAWLMFLGPIALLGTLLWAGFRSRPGASEEVNFGVYKGAMPLEMITASHAHLVVTGKRPRGALFKSREAFDAAMGRGRHGDE